MMVLVGISIDGPIDLKIIRNGALTGRRCRDENFRPVVIPYIAAIGVKFMLVDENCIPHYTNLVDDFLSKKESLK